MQTSRGDIERREADDAHNSKESKQPIDQVEDVLAHAKEFRDPAAAVAAVAPTLSAKEHRKRGLACCRGWDPLMFPFHSAVEDRSYCLTNMLASVS